MRMVLGAALAGAMLAAWPAAAQTETGATASACAALSAPPSLPDGATANYEQMEAGNAAYNAWSETNRAALECRRTEAQELEARYQALRAAYNAAIQQVNETRTSWEAEVTEFNARAPQQQRRRDEFDRRGR